MKQEELVKERDFYRAKLAEANARIKSLEFDNAELVKRDQDLTKRMSEVASKPTSSYRPKRRYN
jgi:predicted nuclease with TOPRIM domain